MMNLKKSVLSPTVPTSTTRQSIAGNSAWQFFLIVNSVEFGTRDNFSKEGVWGDRKN